MKLKESEEEDDLEEETEEENAEEAEEGTVAVESDNVGDASVEINVEELIHDLEAEGLASLGKEQAAKRRLEDLMERKRAKRDLEDFEDYDV